MTWQPIKTAGHTGELVWLYWTDGLVPDGDPEWHEPINQCVGKWVKNYRGGNWVVPMVSVYFGVPSDPSSDVDFIEVDPTHWMPLPKPPK